MTNTRASTRNKSFFVDALVLVSALLSALAITLVGFVIASVQVTSGLTPFFGTWLEAWARAFPVSLADAAAVALVVSAAQRKFAFPWPVGWVIGIVVAGAVGLCITAVALIAGTPNGTGAVYGFYSAGIGLWCAFVGIPLARLIRRAPGVAYALLAITVGLAAVGAVTIVAT